MSAENLKRIKPIKRQIRDKREFEKVVITGLSSKCLEEDVELLLFYLCK